MKPYAVGALYYVDGCVRDNDFSIEYDTIEEAQKAFSEFDPRCVYTREELEAEGSYVTVLLEDHTGEETEILDSKDFD